jgi:hypothetical protein
MRPEADKLQGMITNLAIDKNEVAAQMAIAEVLPLAVVPRFLRLKSRR